MYMIRDRPQKASPIVVEASRANILLGEPALKFDFASYCCLMVLHYSGGLANVTIVFYDLKNPHNKSGYVPTCLQDPRHWPDTLSVKLNAHLPSRPDHAFRSFHTGQGGFWYFRHMFPHMNGCCM